MQFNALVAPDERISRAVMQKLRIFDQIQLRQDLHGQLFPQLNAPLIERVNLPDSALGENTVLVERHQLAERFRC